MTLRACLVCGEPSDRSRCPEHRPRCNKPPREQRGYDYRWQQLSRRARRLQPWCIDCGATEDLQADHKPEAWQRKEAGLPIRLRDIEVRCGACNRKAGAARGRAVTRADAPWGSDHPPVGKAEFESLSPLLFPVEGDLTENVDGQDVCLDLVRHHDQLGGEQHVRQGTDDVVVGDVVAQDAAEGGLVELSTRLSREIRREQSDAAIYTGVEGVFIHKGSLP